MTDDAYRPLPAGPDVPTPSHTHYRFGEPTKTWAYLDQDQNILYYISRYDPPGEKKQFCPQTWDGQQWQWRAWPPKRAIYNLDRLAARPDAWASVVEGEKCTDAVDQLLPRCIPTTAAGGCGALHLADWSPLYGRSNIILWPDNDPKSIAAFDNLAAHLAEHSPKSILHLIDPSGSGEQGWDSFDALKANWTPASTAAWAKPRTRIYDGPREDPWKPARPAPTSARMSDEDRELSRALDRQEAAQQSALDYPEPVDLFRKPLLPPLEPRYLPAALREYVFDQSALIGSDPGILAISSLVAVAGAAHDGWRVQMKEHDGGGFSERPCLWGAWVAGPGARKSPAQRRATSILRDIDNEWSERFKKEEEAYKIDLRVHKECENKYIKDRAKAAMNGGGYSSPVQPPQKPQNKRLLADDATIEYLALMLEHNPRGCVMPFDELSGWFGGMDAYKSSGVTSLDRSRWLEAYEGGKRRIDRVSRQDAPIIVPNWSICVMGGIQPDAMRGIAAKLPEDGLLQRFMLTMAADAVEDEDRPYNVTAKDRYVNMIRRLAREQQPAYATALSPEARQEFRWLSRECQTIASADGISPRLRSHLGKIDGLFGRLCITYHLADAADRGIDVPREVSGATAASVGDFIRDYLLRHIRVFYDELLSDSRHRAHATWIAHHVTSGKLDVLENRRLLMNYRGWDALPDWTRDSTMRMLEDAGWLFPIRSDSPGRRVTRWNVNPLVHQKYAKYGEAESARRAEVRESIRKTSFGRALLGDDR